MGAADIVKNSLESRLIRRAIVSTGVRVIKSQDIQQSTAQQNSNIVSVIFDWGKRLVGFIVTNLRNAVAWSISAIWGTFVSLTQFVWHFNWNATDQQLDQQIRTTWNQIAGQTGGVVGQFLGWLACGVVPGAIIFTFNEVAGAFVLKRVGEQMAEELAGSIASLIRSTFRAGATTLFVWAFKNARKLIRNNSALVGQIFGAQAERAIEAWGTAKAKPWSFALATEEAIEAIPNEALRNFTEQMLEEFFESCVEAGYVVANSVDSLIAAQKFKADVLGRQRVVEITPNRDIPNERIILAGNEKVLMPQIASALSHYQLLDNKDIGTDLGGFRTEIVRSNPISLQIKIRWYSVTKPPYKDRYAPNGVLTKAEYTLPYVKRTAVDWDKIKLAAGGSNGYNWGRFKATCKLKAPNDAIHCMVVYGGSEQEAEERLRALVGLTECEILTLNAAEEKKVGRRATNVALHKETVRVYPAWFSVINQQKTLFEENSIQMLRGNYQRSNSPKIRLFTDTKPSGIDEVIAEALRTPGSAP
jgi:hypothetical protein